MENKCQFHRVGNQIRRIEKGLLLRPLVSTMDPWLKVDYKTTRGSFVMGYLVSNTLLSP